MGRFIDLTGQKFGKLTVIERSPDHIQTSGKHITMWRCRCECGKEINTYTQTLRNGEAKSCGCLRRNIIEKHGMSNTKLFRIWSGIKSRCYNLNNKKYQDYGARKIIMCPSWLDKDNGFNNFYNDVSKLSHFGEQGYSINRIDNNGNYEPSNVEWSTYIEQNNNRRNNRFIEYNGEIHTIAEWARKTGIKANALRIRIDRLRWDIQQAFTTPVKKRRNNND